MVRDDHYGWVNIVSKHRLFEHVECRSLIEYLVFRIKGAKALEGRGKKGWNVWELKTVLAGKCWSPTRMKRRFYKGPNYLSSLVVALIVATLT